MSFANVFRKNLNDDTFIQLNFTIVGFKNWIIENTSSMRKIKCSMIMIKGISDQPIRILLQKALFCYGTVTIFCSGNVMCVRSKFAKEWDLFCLCCMKTTCPVCLLK